jgi:hypothetical protein
MDFFPFPPINRYSKEALIMEKIAPNQGEQHASSATVDGATLARLIDEVRNEDLSVARSYDRSHNRHNR